MFVASVFCALFIIRRPSALLMSCGAFKLLCQLLLTCRRCNAKLPCGSSSSSGNHKRRHGLGSSQDLHSPEAFQWRKEQLLAIAPLLAPERRVQLQKDAAGRSEDAASKSEPSGSLGVWGFRWPHPLRARIAKTISQAFSCLTAS